MIAPFTYNGETRTVAEWARRMGIPEGTFRRRVRCFSEGKMTLEDVFAIGNLQQQKVRTIEYQGKTYTLDGLSAKLEVSVDTIRQRLSLIKQGKMASEKLFVRGPIAQSKRDMSGRKKYELNDGKKVSLCDLANLSGVSCDSISRMVKKGKGIDEIWKWANDPNRRLKKATWVGGKRMKLDDIGKDLGLCHGAIAMRIKSGWDIVEATSTTKITTRERIKRMWESRKRNQRKRELRKMGLVV